ncbi:phosphatidate cytidylyltransferase [Bacilliculturomica massiliensis]|uniref:phosphatidate cytidylyltransferase n=1 Tax=Bacilliculturomica massiliensis TaxID=1917867 RepID=UPI001031C497|nr:phosphatidate cytidylyltransferase [Bacilliculturomica massiliensis]
MKTRIISGLIMLPLLAVVYFGGYLLTAACFLVGLLGIGEFYRGFESLKVHPSHTAGYAMLAALYALHLLSGYGGVFYGSRETLTMLWFFLSVLFSLLYLFRIEERSLEDGLATVTGIFYVIFFSYHVVLIDELRTGQNDYHLLVWLVFLTAFGTDIMAYFSGYFFGKHKLCPKISPKKTVEGSVGGVLGSVILCGVFGWFVVPQLLIHCMVIGVLGGVVSQFGDLTASIFKRKMGIKDYGNLIPGHGGILDRFDSVLFTAPLVYYYIALVLMR